jgi:hypothetical protein
MREFLEGDKVIKKNETDASQFGHVLAYSPNAKPGYIAVYFRRCVWIKPENLMHFEEWERKRQTGNAQIALRGSLKNYWNGQV